MTTAAALRPPIADRLPDFGQGAGAWLWDARAERLFADARFARLTGLDAAELAAGMPTEAFFAGVHPDDRVRIRIAVAGVLGGTETFSKDFRVRGADGAVRWVSGRGRGERDADGRLTRFSGVLADITEQKRIEEQLRIAQTAGGVGSFEYVDGFGTAVVSEQFCRLLGLHPADSLPVRTINLVVHPDDPPIIGAGAGQEDGPSTYSELRIRRANTGEERWIARRGEHRADGVGQGPRFVGVIYDITAAKQAEAKLRDLARTLEDRVEERTRERDRVWSLARDLFLVISLDGVYRAVNPAWTKVLGYAEDELVGRPRGDLLHPDDRAPADERFAELLRGDAVESIDVRMRGADGGWRWINWSFVSEEDAIYGVGRDVTERTVLEEQLRQSQKMEAVGQLTGGLAHDFNNMLTGIIGGLELAQRRMEAGRDEDATRYMQTAAASAERAAALTHRLLAFSRRQTLDPKAVDVGDLVRSMDDMLRRTLGEQVQLKVVWRPELWRARVDGNQLENAILNLAINGRDAMPGGGALTIECENLSLDHPYAGAPERIEPGDYVVVSVSDTGVGMSEAVRARVFDPFFTTKPIGKGTGLGLSMVYGFVRQSGGHVSLYSEPGVGTTIRLYLPRIERTEGPAGALGRAAPAPAGAGETVLVVEDEAQVRLLLTTVLHDLGYDTVEAADGASAIEALESLPHVRLLITDVGLPGLNGRQLADLARQSRPELPVLFVTGYAHNAAAGEDFLEPGMRMISKPFSLEQFAAALNAIWSATP